MKQGTSHHPHEPQFSAGGRHATHKRGAESDAEGGNDRSLTLASVARDSRLDSKFILLISLSSAIATLGLLQNSTAVVIGAMLVSPLLGPIMGIGFGLATLESTLIKRALTTLAAGMGVAILVALVLIWLSPIQDVTDELRARTQPTLLDLGVAVVGGIAGVYAIMRRLSGVMVGVAIATALVPPLSTVGFGMATARPDYALGAALLFLTNSLAIAFAATVVARINRFGPSLTPQHTAMQVVGIIAVLGLLSVPLGLSLNQLVREATARRVVQSTLAELVGRSARVDMLDVKYTAEKVIVEGVLLVPAYDPTLASKVERMAAPALGRKVEATFAQIKQERGSDTDAQRRLADRVTALETRDGESTEILAALTVGDLIGRDRITLDAQARRAIINYPAAGDAQLNAAIDRVIAAARQDHPQWLITRDSNGSGRQN